MYAVLSVNSFIIKTWIGREGWHNFVFCKNVRGMDKKERHWGGRWEQFRGYKWIWEVRGMTFLTGLGRPCIGALTLQIGTHTKCIWDGKLTRTHIFLKSQSLNMSSPIPSHLCLCLFQLYPPLRKRNQDITLYHSMRWSRVIAQCSLQ